MDNDIQQGESAEEEQHPFPALERHGVPREGGPLGVMLHEHELGRALLRAHVDKENGVFFPIAEQILAEEEQRVIVQAFDAIEQAVVGLGSHERLLAKLVELEGR